MITSPARKIPRRFNGVSGRFPSKKNGGSMVPFESLLERNYMLLLEFDNSVSSYVEQPVTIPYQIPKGRKSRYTPDIIVYFHLDDVGNAPKPNLIEVKPSSEFERLREELAPKFEAARKLSDQNGWIFLTKSEKDINGPFFENADFLYEYLGKPEHPIEQNVIQFIDACGGEVAGSEIFKEFSFDDASISSFAPIFWGMVANKVLLTDWNQFINLDSLFR